MPPASIKLALVDDHSLFRKGLISIIEMVAPACVILFEANSGQELQVRIDPTNLPDIIIVDVSMPGMDGFSCVDWLKVNHPSVHVLIVSMIQKEETVVRMLRMGVKGYLCKDVEPQELANALEAIKNKGFYYTDYVTGALLHSLHKEETDERKPQPASMMNDQERKFLQLACSELTYHEIADKMFLSPKTIDGYRNSLFEKLKVKSRVGLVIYAIRHGLVSL